MPVRIIEMFQPHDMRRAVPDQRFMTALHGAMDLGDAQIHVPHGSRALSDESGRVVLPLFYQPVFVTSNKTERELFTALFLKILVSDPYNVGKEHRCVNFFLVEYLHPLGIDVGGAGNFPPASPLWFHPSDAPQTA